MAEAEESPIVTLASRVGKRIISGATRVRDVARQKGRIGLMLVWGDDNKRNPRNHIDLAVAYADETVVRARPVRVLFSLPDVAIDRARGIYIREQD